MPAEHGCRLSELLPHGHYTEIPDARVLVQLDQPRTRRAPGPRLHPVPPARPGAARRGRRRRRSCHGLVVTDTRDRIVDAAVDLFRVHGYTGTAMKQVVAAADAPYGSVYHHFRGGKEELAAVGHRAGRRRLPRPGPRDHRHRGRPGVRHPRRVRGGGDGARRDRLHRRVPGRDRGPRGGQHQRAPPRGVPAVFDDWIEAFTARLVEAGAERAAARSASLTRHRGARGRLPAQPHRPLARGHAGQWRRGGGGRVARASGARTPRSTARVPWPGR